jgi:hypothetical protein
VLADDLAVASRWREENYFRYARTRFALDALDSYAATPDDPGRLIPNPAKKPAAAQVRRAEALATAAEAARDAALLKLLIRLDLLTAPRRTQALAVLCDQLTQASARYPGTDLVLRYEVKPHVDPA